MINIDDFHYLKAIVHHQNLRKAAAELHVTQPALSHTLKKFEKEFGMLLFERSKKGVCLTPEGKVFYSRCEDLISKWDGLKLDLSTRIDNVEGRVLIGCHPSVARYSFGKYVAKFLEKYPKVEFKLEHALSRTINDAVCDSDVDLGIVVNPFPHPDLIIKPLSDDVVSLWQASANKNGETLIYDPALVQSQYILKVLGKKLSGFTRHIHSSNLEVVASMASSGIGVAILPGKVAAGTGLKKLKNNTAQYKDKICLVYKKNFRDRELGKQVISVLRKEFS